MLSQIYVGSKNRIETNRQQRYTLESLISLFSYEEAKLGIGKCSKILNAICLPKRPRKTVQTQIRLLLKNQSDQGLSCLLLCEF